MVSPLNELGKNSQAREEHSENKTTNILVFAAVVDKLFHDGLLN